MRIVESITELVDQPEPLVLTIGNYDGVHLGHLSILSRVQQMAKIRQITSAMITFKNHPLTLLRPNHPIPLLTSPAHKLKLLEKADIDLVFMLDFNQQFAEQSAEEFLTKVHTHHPFRYLILGHDAKLGNDRQGNSPFLHRLARDMHFILEFLPPVMRNNQIISSSLIRDAIQNNQLAQAAEYLGRPFSVYGQTVQGQGIGHEMGFPTLNLQMKGLCHPLFGVYIVTVKSEKGTFRAVSDLGFAPTVRHDHVPLLETYLIDAPLHNYGERIEVIFEEYLRPERIYTSLDELKMQISEDVETAKAYHPSSFA